MTNTVIIIPSRLQATRLPEKPLKIIKGKEMVLHVLDLATKSGVGDVLVATPDTKISDLINKNKGKSFLSQKNHQTGTDRVFEAYEKYFSNNPKFIINLQGDLPTIDPILIDLTYDLLKKNKDSDITTLCSPINIQEEFENPDIVKAYVKKRSQPSYASDFVRLPGSYDLKKLYHHLGIYGYKRESLKKFIKLDQSQREKDLNLEQLRALDNGMKIVIDFIDQIPIGVDTEDDLYNVIKELSN